MKQSVALLSVALSAFSAVAAEPETPQITVSAEDCKRLLQHTPSADVAYKSGVDVRGKAVVPADMGGDSPLKVPTEITLDFGLDFAGRYGIGGALGTTATAKLFEIKYDLALGALTVGGKPLNQADTEAVARACK